MRIVCVTPAGRRRYMSILAPYVLSDPTVGEWQIWLNTVDAGDLAWLATLGGHPKVRLIEPPSERPNGGTTIGQFWRFCADDDAIYVRLDDDVVWLERDFFARLVDARMRHPQAFLVSAMVVNNAHCSYVLQISGVVKFTDYFQAQCMSSIAWRDADFAEKLHGWAINKIESGQLPWRVGDHPVAMSRLSINAICYFGRDAKPFVDKIGPEEEEFVSCVLPTTLHRTNMITSDAWCAHFSYYPQRDHLDRTPLLESYRKLMLARFGSQGLPP